MASHSVEIERVAMAQGRLSRYRARCCCGYTGELYAARFLADGDGEDHLSYAAQLDS